MAAGGATLQDVVVVRAYVVDSRNISTYLDILREMFPVNSPASTLVEISELAVPGLLFEIDAVAVL